MRDTGRHLRRQASHGECTYRDEMSATACPLMPLQIAQSAPSAGGGRNGKVVYFTTLLLCALAACTPAWTGSIGANLGQSKVDGRLTVRESPPTLSGYRAGLREGDEIVSIDGAVTAGMSAAEVHKALSGKVGSHVALVIRRGEETIAMDVERGPYQGK